VWRGPVGVGAELKQTVRKLRLTISAAGKFWTYDRAGQKKREIWFSSRPYGDSHRVFARSARSLQRESIINDINRLRGAKIRCKKSALRPIATSKPAICYVRSTSTPAVPFAQIADVRLAQKVALLYRLPNYKEDCLTCPSRGGQSGFKPPVSVSTFLATHTLTLPPSCLAAALVRHALNRPLIT
jgi:hypothetical protein